MSLNPVVRAEPHDPIMVGPLTIQFLVTGDQSHQTLALFTMTVAPGAGLPGPSHYHGGYEETLYGLTGTLTWTVDGFDLLLQPGEAICIPRSAVHRFTNAGESPATVLVAVTPAGIGPDYFQEIAEALAAAGTGPPDAQRMGTIMTRYGLTPTL